MSIIEHSAPSSAPPGAGVNDRLRVITAGRVGNMEARLGTSGFDVVAIADTEEELIIALSADEPDAIVVEADLCESLEHVRELAPDAVLIAVGDHTPAGALGRIDRGVSGTAMAGLLHALVAEGVGGAAVWGFLPASRTTGPVSVPEYVSASLLSTKVAAAGDAHRARGPGTHRVDCGGGRCCCDSVGERAAHVGSSPGPRGPGAGPRTRTGCRSGNRRFDRRDDRTDTSARR